MISIMNFGGELPRIDPAFLPPHLAQTAKNCKLRNGILRALKDSTSVNTPTKAGTKKTVYLYAATYWFHWITDVDVVRSPIVNDTTERTYFTGDGVPKVTDSSIATSGGGTDYPNNSYTLGVPAPANAISAAKVTRSGNITSASINATPVSITTSSSHNLATGSLVMIAGLVGTGVEKINGKIWKITVTGSNTFTLDNSEAISAYTSGGTWDQRYDETDLQSRAYVYTYVSAWGEEGEASAASNILDVGPDQQVDLSGMSTGPAGNYNITKKRIYRAATGASGTEYLFVAEINVANSTYSDTLKDSALGERIPGIDWSPPPTDMAGIRAMPNGVVIGFSKNTLCPSVPFQPHAYPVKWRQATDTPIVGFGVMLNTAVVLTQGHPYLYVCTHPESASLTKVENNYSCVSKRGIVSLGENGVFGVVYPSPDGLVMVSPGGGWNLITAKHFTKDEWQSRVKPSSITASTRDGMYVGFYDNGVTQGGFIFDPTDPERGLIFIDAYATAAFANLVDDELYLQIGNDIKKFEGSASKISYTWKSKLFQSPVPKPCYAFGCVIAPTYASLTLKLYADGSLKHTQVVTSGEYFPLPPDYWAYRHEVELTGTDDVRAVIVAHSPEEIKNALEVL